MSDISKTPASLRATRYALLWAGIPLAVAVTLGLIKRPDLATPVQPAARESHPPASSMVRAAHVTPDRFRHMADKQAEPLLAQLQSRPNDPELLAKLGYVYFVAKNFMEASTYFRRSVELRDDAIVRNELGRAYYYAGEPDKALAEFERVLQSDPDNINALFNLGMVKWRSWSDAEGALVAWQQILKKNPHHPRRAELEQLITRARQAQVAREPMQAAHTSK